MIRNSRSCPLHGDMVRSKSAEYLGHFIESNRVCVQVAEPQTEYDYKYFKSLMSEALDSVADKCTTSRQAFLFAHLFSKVWPFNLLH